MEKKLIFWFFIPLSIVCVGLIAYGIWISLIASKKPNITLVKEDWTCTSTVKKTHLNTSIIGKSITLTPITNTVCIEYTHK